jgi:hypothetical protein
VSQLLLSNLPRYNRRLHFDGFRHSPRVARCSRANPFVAVALQLLPHRVRPSCTSTRSRSELTQRGPRHAPHVVTLHVVALCSYSSSPAHHHPACRATAPPLPATGPAFRSGLAASQVPLRPFSPSYRRARPRCPSCGSASSRHASAPSAHLRATSAARYHASTRADPSLQRLMPHRSPAQVQPPRSSACTPARCVPSAPTRQLPHRHSTPAHATNSACSRRSCSAVHALPARAAAARRASTPAPVHAHAPAVPAPATSSAPAFCPWVRPRRASALLKPTLLLFLLSRRATSRPRSARLRHHQPAPLACLAAILRAPSRRLPCAWARSLARRAASCPRAAPAPASAPEPSRPSARAAHTAPLAHARTPASAEAPRSTCARPALPCASSPACAAAWAAVLYQWREERGRGKERFC